MATHITQIDDPESGTTILRIDGVMLLADALLIERIASGVHSELETMITLDLAGLDFMDSDAASVLKRLEDEKGYKLDGMDTFLQTAVNDVEKRNARNTY